MKKRSKSRNHLKIAGLTLFLLAGSLCIHACGSNNPPSKPSGPVNTPTSTFTPTSSPTNLPTPSLVATWTISGPMGLAVSGNSLYACSFGTPSNVQKFNLSGTPDPTWPKPQVDTPFGIALDAGGNVYVSSDHGEAVYEFNSMATPVATYAATSNSPAVALDASGNVYAVLDSNAIEKFFASQIAPKQWNTGSCPKAIQIAGSPQTIYVGTIGTSSEKGTFNTMDLNGAYLNNSWYTYQNTSGLAFNSAGNVYTVGNAPDYAKEFTLSGTLLTQWGPYRSNGVAVDGSDNIYVSDDSNNAILKFTP